jgi:hypothetical protein
MEELNQEVYSPDEEIFEGGPTNKQIEEWKHRYESIYATEFEDEVYIWRTLSRLEFKEVQKAKNADPMYKEERICEKCVLWPEEYGHTEMAQGKAGTPSVIAEHIMDKSGFMPNGEAKKL